MFSRILYKTMVFVVILAVFGCAHHIKLAEEEIKSVYMVDSTRSDPISQYAPVFLTHNYEKEHNRIGRPSAIIKKNDREKIYIDVNNPVIYYMVRHFRTEKDSYTNYVYRIHFPRVPFSLIPFNLTAGKNIGLISVVTVDSRNRPVLISTVHTCGCYLAIVPTSNLSDNAFPDNWNDIKLKVFGERLPPKLDYSNYVMPRLLIHLRPGVHRVMDLEIIEEQHIVSNDGFIKIITPTTHMDELTKIPVDSTYTSLYHTEGPMKGFVKGSVKFWESLFLSLISLDIYIGTDKIYGDPDITGNTFYTSLKPWNRNKSEMWDFKRFLEFWGWKL